MTGSRDFVPSPFPLDATVVARLTASEATARHLVAVLGESFDATHAVVGAFEGTAGDWHVAIHFRDPPNETAVRALVALASGADIANALLFETIAVRDWVSASLAGLAPVDAGRFVVHGAHDRARVAANRIGIEIEAALAFGTGHHGTTRGCLKALDTIVKAGRPRSILDVGTGSGVIALTLAAQFPQAEVHAVDISDDALELARENAARLDLGERVRFAKGNLLHGIEGTFDLIVANLPYVPTTDRATLSHEVLHDPEAAVFAGERGDELVRELIIAAPDRLRPGGLLALEVGIGQADGLTALLAEKNYHDIASIRDYCGVKRFLFGRYG